MKAINSVYDRDTMDYIDAVLFDGKKGTYVQRDGKIYIYCGDMRLDCGEVEETTVRGGDATDPTVFKKVPNPEYGLEFKENGEFVLMREESSYGLVFRGSKIRPLKFGAME